MDRMANMTELGLSNRLQPLTVGAYASRTARNAQFHSRFPASLGGLGHRTLHRQTRAIRTGFENFRSIEIRMVDVTAAGTAETFSAHRVAPSLRDTAAAIWSSSSGVASFFMTLARNEITQTLPGTYPSDGSTRSSEGDAGCGFPPDKSNAVPKTGQTLGITTSATSTVNSMPRLRARRFAITHNVRARSLAYRSRPCARNLSGSAARLRCADSRDCLRDSSIFRSRRARASALTRARFSAAHALCCFRSLSALAAIQATLPDRAFSGFAARHARIDSADMVILQIPQEPKRAFPRNESRLLRCGRIDAIAKSFVGQHEVNSSRPLLTGRAPGRVDATRGQFVCSIPDTQRNLDRRT